MMLILTVVIIMVSLFIIIDRAKGCGDNELLQLGNIGITEIYFYCYDVDINGCYYYGQSVYYY